MGTSPSPAQAAHAGTTAAYPLASEILSGLWVVTKKAYLQAVESAVIA